MMNGSAGILRASRDLGLLSNVRMAAEVATGLAFLTGRRLSLPFEAPIGNAPMSSISEADRGEPARLLDVLEFPIEVVPSEEWLSLDQSQAEVQDWGEVGQSVCVCENHIKIDEPQLRDFANGRTKFRYVPFSSTEILRIDGRLLSHYSYFFYARPALRRQLHAVLRGVRPRRCFIELAAHIAADVGQYNVAHIRRSDLTIGIPAYGDVTPDHVALSLAKILPQDELLVVCSEVDGRDELFDPVRREFSKVVFANDLILHDHRAGFFAMPTHEDNALGLVTQQFAARAQRYVGTAGSTFSAMIHRERVLRNPNERFLYTADFLPPGAVFENGEYVDSVEGSYSWNRHNYSIAPETLAWFREWPEVS